MPPLDIFYSPQHKAIVKMGRKKRKLDQSQSLMPNKLSSFEFLWKGSSATPTKELGKLTQFVGAYASATIDKVVEVQELLKEKEEKIISLKQKFNTKKQKITKQWHNQFAELQNKFDTLKL